MNTQSSGSGASPFLPTPSTYPKTRNAASRVVKGLIDLQSRGPRTIVGTVVDTTFHISQGYVLCTTQNGVVQVYGAPYGKIVPGMRLFIRQLGSIATNRSFIYDGEARALSTMGQSGSLMVKDMLAANPITAPVSVSGVPTDGSTATAVGYYWHCFFYLSMLPNGNATIFQMRQTASPNLTLTLQMQPSGLLQFISSDGHGYVTTQPVAPHVPHWIAIIPGISGQEMLIDTLSLYTGIASPTDDPSFTGGGSATYTLAVGSNYDGSQLLPIGSWVSKIGYGLTNVSQTAQISSVIPEQDSDITTVSGSHVLYLCGDGEESATAANSVVGGAGSLSIVSPFHMSALGPY